MKKFLLSTLAMIILLILVITGTLFLRPGLVINPKNLSFLLHKTKVLKTWSWKNATFTHEWRAWNDRLFSGEFQDFCFNVQNPKADVDACFEKISWSLNLNFNWGEGVHTKTLEPLVVRSSKLIVIPGKSDEESTGDAPDIWGYWSKLWSDLVPDMDFRFLMIQVKETKFDLTLIKKPKTLAISALNFELNADPEKFILKAPEAYPIPRKLPLAKQPLYLRDVVLTGYMKEKGIRLLLNGFFETIKFDVNSYVDLPLKHDVSSPEFRKEVILKTNAKATLSEFKSNLNVYGPRPYNILPAPFNVLDGIVEINVKSEKTRTPNDVLIKATSHLDLKSSKQVIDMDIDSDVIFDVMNNRPGKVDVGVNFNQVAIQLPRFSKKSPPPQFMPDKRFKKNEAPKKPKEGGPDVSLDLEATNEKALHIRTNLLDEVLRLNFNLMVEKGNLREGFVKVLPLKTSIFKRPIRLDKLVVRFQAPLEPVLNATIKFPLPEYKITLNLEGPVSKPRYNFESDPPLPQNDIYAVLLFGRPLADLDPDDKTAANQTNQILSQGILSLGVLYFLAGSPVEYVGYDPGSKNATAQFGLGKKSSLRVGGGREGLNSTAIRRSLGKGWYIDTSVQTNTKNTTSESKNYGVLLERIISY